MLTLNLKLLMQTQFYFLFCLFILFHFHLSPISSSTSTNLLYSNNHHKVICVHELFLPIIIFAESLYFVVFKIYSSQFCLLKKPSSHDNPIAIKTANTQIVFSVYTPLQRTSDFSLKQKISKMSLRLLVQNSIISYLP